MDPEGNQVLKEVISKLGDGVDVGSQDEPDGFYNQLAIRSKREESLADKENKEIMEMRKMWARWILIFIGIIIIFDIILLYFLA